MRDRSAGGQTLIAAGADDTFALATTRQVTTSYGYDRLYRLTSGGTPGSPNAYTHDPNWNRLSLTQGFAAPTNYAYDQADRLQSVGGQSYSVDANGNLTAYPGATLAYDQANRLKTATISGTTTSYVYDGDGKRASKTVGSMPTTYSYDANRSLPVVLTDGSLKYVWGNGLAYATDYSGNVVDVYHTDGLGSVRAITNATGVITQTYETDEFGVASLVQGTSGQPFGFTGEQADAESSFVFLRARYYDPSLGRFLSRDTIAGARSVPGSLNRYSYVRDNPLLLTDPTGKRDTDEENGIGFVIEEGSSSDTSSRGDTAAVPSNEVGNQAVNRVSWASYAQERGPLEGTDPYPVEDPSDPGRTITDIDERQGRILWEHKSGYWAPDPEAWASDQVTAKFYRYLEARNYLPNFYRNAAIGFRWDGAASPEMKAAVEQAVADLRAANPGVSIFLDWGGGS